jgi:synaptic vesicle membrane protein VAT-1
MEKIVIRRPGDYRRLELEQCADLVPSEGQVIVSVKASGVNYADVIIRWGLYESARQLVGWPITPGFEFAGVVKNAPAGSLYREGDEVFGVSLFNAYASEVSVPEHQLFPLPSGLNYAQAAAIPAVFMTAYHALFQNVVTRAGMVALIHSAAGGVGSSLIQLCRIAGIKTIGVVGSTHKVEYCQSLGCDHVIDKSREELWPRVKQLAPGGVDLIFDANGVSTLKQSYQHLAACGKLIAYGAHSMFPKQGGKVSYPKLIWDYLRTPRFNPLSMTSENKSLITFNLSFLFDRHDLLTQAMTDVRQWLGEGKILAPAVKTYPLREVGEAHRFLESGASVGKLVLLP